ncbi:MAG: hypothetical protein ABSH56_37205 [Bryobacteraceae bacterium]|jgi:hypothetical protein
MACLRLGALAGLMAACAAGQAPVRVIFLEPVSAVDARRAEISDRNPLYRLAANPERYAPWLNNESAARAFRFYRDACEIAHPGSGVPDYYVALVKGGNHAATGFRLEIGGKLEEHPRQPYILLDAEDWRFETTLLHETGHMAISMLAGGHSLEAGEIAAIPHSTAALTDRNTAFNEGYAIHLETVQGHVGRDSSNRQRYHREMVLFGDAPFQQAEYFHHSADLVSYSQTVARYSEVRENNFAFESAFQGPDYLRVQLEKVRDFATVRDANQLLQAEGYYASFFFLFMMRGAHIPDAAMVDARERQMLSAIQAAFTLNPGLESGPWLLRVVTEYMKLFPEEKTEIVNALDDTSHGVFVDPAAARLWRGHYLSALRLDVVGLNRAGLAEARRRWREQVLADPAVLLSRLGPEVPCELPSAKVRLAAFDEEAAVRFDVNTVQSGILRLIPGIGEAEIDAVLAARTVMPFSPKFPLSMSWK